MKENKHRIDAIPQQHCSLCGSVGKYLYLNLQDRLFGANGTWNLAKCNNFNCGLMWIDPTPDEAEIGNAYSNYYTHEMQEDIGRCGILKRSYHWMKRGYLMDKFGYTYGRQPSMSKALGKFLYFFPQRRSKVDEEVRYLQALPQGRLLDVGCGSGEWLQIMSGLGWEAEGIDFDKNAVNIAKQTGLHAHWGSLENQNYPDECFDAITLNHVIEHIPNPVATLVECRRILKKSGKLVLFTPNIASLGHRVFKQSWRGLEPPRHLYLFCPSSMRTLLELAGFDEFFIRTINSGYIWKHSFMLCAGEGECGRTLRFATKVAHFALTLIEQLLLLGNPKVGESLAVQAFKK
ncbi:MAG: class I SAM-dependent methyltransferase [Burkholderiaceae bacterium]